MKNIGIAIEKTFDTHLSRDTQRISGNIARDAKGDQKDPKETKKRRNEMKKAHNSKV